MGDFVRVVVLKTFLHRPAISKESIEKYRCTAFIKGQEYLAVKNSDGGYTAVIPDERGGHSCVMPQGTVKELD